MAANDDRQIGIYTIQSRLGAGGMGEVYRARDTTLGRDVALKVLPAAFATDPDRRARLLREARAAAALNHPNVCTIHEIGEADGRAYIAMEVVDGRPLSARVAEHALPAEDVVCYGLQLADALAHAHDRGVVHRDLKSANVMVTPEGRIKVLDFGLATVAVRDLGDEETLLRTEPGIVAGTLPYMAPEQLRGLPVDGRTDIWALGVVFHEMLTGARPFTGRTGFEVSSAILHEPPPPLPESVPAPLQAIVNRCLEKEPSRRYQRASEVRTALETVGAGASTMTATRSVPVRPANTRLLAALGAVLVVLAGVALFWSPIRHLTGGPGGRIQSLAVLPLQNLSNDPEQEYFAAGMHEALITDLARIGLQKAIAKPSSDMFKGTSKSLRDVGRELGVDGLVTGAVMRAGNRVQLTARLVKAETGEVVWANRYKRSAGDVLALQNELVTSIAREVRATVTAEQSARLASRRPVDPAAHDAYLRGRSFFAQMAGAGPDRKYMDGAIAEYEKAIRIDPAYAPPQAGLAHMYLTVSQTSTFPPSTIAAKAKAAALKAIELDDGLAEAHASLGGVLLWLEWNWTGAEREIKRALELNPDSVDALTSSMGYALLVGNRPDDAEATSQRVLILDPLNPFSRIQRVWVAVGAKRFDQVIARAQALQDVWPGNIMSPFFLAHAHASQRRADETAADCATVLAATSGAFSMQTTGVCAWALGLVGRTTQARQLIASLEHPPAGTWLDPGFMAPAYGGVGDMDRALEWMERGLNERAPNMIYAKVAPIWDFGRGNPRFEALLRRMNFPP